MLMNLDWHNRMDQPLDRIVYSGTLLRREDTHGRVALRFSAWGVDPPPASANILAIEVEDPVVSAGSLDWLAGAELVELEHSSERARLHLMHIDEPVEVSGSVLVGWRDYDTDDYRLCVELMTDKLEEAEKLGDEARSRIRSAISAIDKDNATVKYLKGASVTAERWDRRHESLVRKVRRILSGDV